MAEPSHLLNRSHDIILNLEEALENGSIDREEQIREFDAKLGISDTYLQSLTGRFDEMTVKEIGQFEELYSRRQRLRPQLKKVAESLSKESKKKDNTVVNPDFQR